MAEAKAAAERAAAEQKKADEEAAAAAAAEAVQAKSFFLFKLLHLTKLQKTHFTKYILEITEQTNNVAPLKKNTKIHSGQETGGRGSNQSSGDSSSSRTRSSQAEGRRGSGGG
jgi:hypothetical protein